MSSITVNWALGPFQKSSTVNFELIFGLSSTFKLEIKTGTCPLVVFKQSIVYIKPDVESLTGFLILLNKYFIINASFALKV